MVIRINDREFQLFKNFIETQCGLALEGSKAYLIENRLSSLVAQSGCSSFGEFFLKVKYDLPPKDLQRKMIDAITTHETFWFRDGYPFRILKSSLFPAFDRELRSGARDGIRIWSAACATGQEAYSIAMTACEYARQNAWKSPLLDHTHILATDVADTCLSRAESGQYDDMEIDRGMSKELLHRYFDRRGEKWTISSKIKNMINFDRYNLLDMRVGFGTFDVVFLRNVVIYFSEDAKQRLFDFAARVLVPGGILFLGTGEMATPYNPRFSPVEVAGARYWRLEAQEDISPTGKNTIESEPELEEEA